MDTEASAKGFFSAFNLVDFDLTAPQPALDAELVKQLSFIPLLKEIIMLRQVHALEHATVWVLSESHNSNSRRRSLKNQFENQFENQFDNQFDNHHLDDELLGGLSTESGFYLYGDVNISDLRRATSQALSRLISGEWNLAVHPRCGTNLSTAMLLTAGFAVGMHLLLPRGPIEQLIGFGVAATTAAELAPDIGALAQKYLTTAIPFNLAVENITLTRDYWGREAHFVKVSWRI